MTRKTVKKELVNQDECKSLSDVVSQQKENSFQEDRGNIESGNIEKTDFQAAQGRLIESPEPSPYETVDEKFEQVAIETIQAVGLIPNYRRSTDLKYPILAKTPLGYFCLEGWNLIEEAKKIRKVTLKCFVEEIEEHSTEELALRKVILRERPRGGFSSYGESVRNVTYLRDILTASDLDLRVFQHGGARKGEAFTGSRQENITKVLSFRLGKSESTIVKYLNHGFLLTDETLNFLAEKEADKDFFEAVQANKRWTMTNLRSQEVSDEEITLQISESMLGWFQEYIKNGKKIKRIWDDDVIEIEEGDHTEVPPAPPLPQETSNSEVSTASTISTETCNEPVPGTETSDEVGPSTEAFDENDSFETLKFSVEALANRLLEANALSDPTEYLDRITAEAKNLAILIKKASVLRNKRLAEEVL